MLSDESESQQRHVAKYTHEDGVALEHPIAWCGVTLGREWHFVGAQHVALAVGGSVQPCKECIKAIIDQLSKEI